MDWYDRLAQYFPEHEMKDEGQMKDLLAHHDAYRKLETDEYLVTFAEFPSFIFIDYLLVKANTRGKGMGSKVLNRFKAKGKVIVLEVEPPDVEDSDTLKRIHFMRKTALKRRN